MKDGGGAGQPGQSLLLQASSVCANGTSTTTCSVTSPGSSTSTATTTSTTTTTTTTSTGGGTQACQATLKVVKHVLGNQVPARRGDLYLTVKGAEHIDYEMFVTNDSNCPALNVMITDSLPDDYDCHAAEWHISEPTTTVHNFGCRGDGRDIKVDLPSLRPDQAVAVRVSGTFVKERKTVNVAHAVALNASPAHSSHIRVEVLSRKQFDAEAIGHPRR